MADQRSPSITPAVPCRASGADSGGAAAAGAAAGTGSTETLVRETWRHYYVAQLAEAQFGPTSVEASLARSRALTSYRELRMSLRELDPYYRPAAAPRLRRSGQPRHLTLVRDEQLACVPTHSLDDR